MIRQRVERAERHASSIFVDVSGPTTPSFRGRVRNVSPTGMLIDTPHALTVGDVLTARAPGAVEVLCTVMRIRAGAAGLRFVRGMDENVVRAWA